MAKFLHDTELFLSIQKIISNAEKKLVLISPYIKLHENVISILKTKLHNDKLKIIIVFGKNENNLSSSISLKDIEFFKQFPNIELRYEKRLHAKFYYNENESIITSMNLYSYSQNNNIESGILMETTSFLSSVLIDSNSLDKQAFDYFNQVIEQSEKLYVKEPKYTGNLLFSKYSHSNVEIDKLPLFFTNLKTDIIPIIDKSDKYFSITSLSKELEISSKNLLLMLEKYNFIRNNNDSVIITEQGKANGICIKTGKYGDYIAYPRTIINHLNVNKIVN